MVDALITQLHYVHSVCSVQRLSVNVGDVEAVLILVLSPTVVIVFSSRQINIPKPFPILIVFYFPLLLLIEQQFIP